MANIVDINKVKTGDLAFLMCSCKHEGEPYMVVGLTGDSPIITALVCTECETQVDVVNGVLQGK